MSNSQRADFQVPILILAFNRPDYLIQLIEKLEVVRPQNIYLAIDGPRALKPDEAALCQECERLFDNLSWKPLVTKRVLTENLGCGKGVSSAISWFFKNVEAGIILEDDCLPDSSFFSYCAELLERYRETPKIMAICGTNLSTPGAFSASYSFSNYCHVWGWATWRRAWDHYDFEMRLWQEEGAHEEIPALIRSLPKTKLYWTEIFRSMSRGLMDTWDFQWVWAIWKSQGLSVIPKTNLVTNIGFDERATHTKRKDAGRSLGVQPLTFPLIHPARIEEDRAHDIKISRAEFSKKNLIERVLQRIYAM